LWLKPRITDAYIIREIFPTFILSSMILTFTLIFNRLILIAESVITKGIPFSLTLQLLSYLIPSFIVLTIPMSILVSIILAFGRLSSDSEITALKAGGCSIWKLLIPVYLFAIMGYLLSTIVYLEVLPRANLKAKEIMYDIARTKADALIEPRVFIKDFDDLIIYINEKLPSSSEMEGVFIDVNKPESPMVFIGKSGRFLSDSESQVPILRIKDGIILQLSDSKGSSKSINEYEQLDFRLPIDDMKARHKIKVYKSEREQNFIELVDHINILENNLKRHTKTWFSIKDAPKVDKIRKENAERNYDIAKKELNVGRIELHRKFATPFACLIFPLIAVPFGIRNRKGSKFTGFAYSLLFFLFYYILLTFGKNMGEEGRLSPILSMWLPNIISGIIGIVFLILESMERSYGFSSILHYLKENKLIQSSIKRFSIERDPVEVNDSKIQKKLPGIIRLPGRSSGRILDFYICKEFFVIAVFVMLGVLSIYNIVEIFERIDDVFESKVSVVYLFKYLYYAQPQIIGYIIPITILISTLLTIAILSKNSEVIAIKAAGISVFRFTAPLIVLGLLASVLSFGLHEKIIPESNKRSEKIWEVDIRHNEPKGLTTQNQIWYRAEGNKIFHITLMIGDVNTLFGVNIYEFNDDFSLKKIVIADTAKWNENGYWDLQKVRERIINSDGVLILSEKEKDIYYTAEKPEDFMREYQKPEEMSYAALKRYITKLEQTGYGTYKYKTDLYNKLAIPLTSLIMVLIAIPFALKVGKSGAMAGIGISIAIGITYFAIHSSFLAVGYSGKIPPFVAAWIGNVFFTCAALYMMTKVDT